MVFRDCLLLSKLYGWEVSFGFMARRETILETGNGALFELPLCHYFERFTDIPTLLAVPERGRTNLPTSRALLSARLTYTLV